MATILLKRGLQANIDKIELGLGEPAFATDTGNLYVGTAAGKAWVNPPTSTVADEAAKLSTARNFSIKGDGTASTVKFDGTQNVELALALATQTGLSAGTYTKLTVNAKGIVTKADNITVQDVSGLGTAATKNTGTSAGNVIVVGSDGKIDSALIPALAVTDIFEAASQSAMLALSKAEQGDICVRSDEGKSYILKQAPSSTLNNWVWLQTPDCKVLSVNGKTGAVTLAKGDIGLGNVDNTADSAKNVLSAAKLTTARTINGVSFNGTSNITIADSTKEPAITAGTASQYWSGSKSWVDFAATVRSAVLTGLSTSTNSAITATDTILTALGKLQAQVSKKANLASPTFTGTPKAPTAAITDNSTQIATTAFVKSQGYLGNDSVIDGGTF